MEPFEGTLVNQLWPYLVVSMISAGFLYSQQDARRGLAAFLVAGSLSYSIAFAVIAPNAGFRYYLFQVIVAILLLCFALLRIVPKASKRFLER